jgi:hypothetical protein
VEPLHFAAIQRLRDGEDRQRRLQRADLAIHS